MIWLYQIKKRGRGGRTEKKGTTVNFLIDLEIARTRDDLKDGLRAAIVLHYHEFTDQTALYGPFAQALRVILDHTYGGYFVDFEEFVSEVELEINSNGGIRSTTDGKRHFVQSFSEVYDEVASK